jgi:PKD repeat protein
MKRLLLVIFVIPAIAFSQVNLNRGLGAYYPFNGNATDASGNNNNPVFNNATLTADRFGNPNSAYLFNGKNNYMRIPNSPTLNSTDQISICAWVKVNGFYQGPCHGNSILKKGDTGYLPGSYSLTFSDHSYTNGQNCVNRVVDPNHQNFYGENVIAPTPGYTPHIQPGTWYHIIYTSDGFTSKFFVNCVLIASSRANGINFTNSFDLFLGKMKDPQFPYWFNGVLDEVRIYNRALNKNEMLALCDNKPIKNKPEIICTGGNVVSAKFNFNITNCTSTNFNLTAGNIKNLKTIQWYFGDGTGSNKMAPVHTYKKYGTFKVKAIAISKTGCADTFTREIHLRELKTDFTYSEQGEPGNIQFKTKNNNASYLWDMGDGMTFQNVSVVTHIYNASGQYKVKMLAQNNTGCVDTVEKLIQITLPVLITEAPSNAEPVSVSPIQADIQLEKRAKEIMQIIPVDNDSVSISLFDNGIVDGDSITLIFNNEVILTHQLLSSKPLKLSLYIDPQKVNNDLVMYAENLGSIPPNTALMIIEDGNNRYQVNVSSSKSSNGAVSFTIKR